MCPTIQAFLAVREAPVSPVMTIAVDVHLGGAVVLKQRRDAQAIASFNGNVLVLLLSGRDLAHRALLRVVPDVQLFVVALPVWWAVVNGHSRANRNGSLDRSYRGATTLDLRSERSGRQVPEQLLRRRVSRNGDGARVGARRRLDRVVVGQVVRVRVSHLQLARTVLDTFVGAILGAEVHGGRLVGR